MSGNRENLGQHINRPSDPYSVRVDTKMQNEEPEGQYGVKLMSVNLINGKWNVLVQWNDSSGSYYITFIEDKRFRADAIVPIITNGEEEKTEKVNPLTT